MTVIPLCPIYESCGGCQYQHVDYPQELALKQALLEQTLSPYLPESVRIEPVVASPEQYYYRNRLDLKLNRYKNGDIKIGFSPLGKKLTHAVDFCPIARKDINDFIPIVKAQAIATIKPRYVQACLVIRSGEGNNPSWGGIGEGSLRLNPNQYFWVDLNRFRIFYSLDTFFQANLSILPTLIDHMRDLPIWSSDSLFFDLYGGVGLFGISLSDRVKRVALIEENKAAVEIAAYNKDYNQINNLDLYDGTVEFVLPKLFKHYGNSPKIVMVDPPRAGLSSAAVNWLNDLTAVEYMLYLSCEPHSLANNLRRMKPYWEPLRVMPYDFFPKTRHVETLILFKRK